MVSVPERLNHLVNVAQESENGNVKNAKGCYETVFYCCNYLLVIRVVLIINVRFIGDGKCTLVYLQHQIRLYLNSMR